MLNSHHCSFVFFMVHILEHMGQNLLRILATEKNQGAVGYNIPSQIPQHLKIKLSFVINQSTHKTYGTQHSAPAVWTDSHVVLACTSDDLIGVALCLDWWHCQAAMTSDTFTGLAKLQKNWTMYQ